MIYVIMYYIVRSYITDGDWELFEGLGFEHSIP